MAHLPDHGQTGNPTKAGHVSGDAADAGPTDFSPCSQKAVLYACAIARSCQATITLLHVIGDLKESPRLGVCLAACNPDDFAKAVASPLMCPLGPGTFAPRLQTLSQSAHRDPVVRSQKARAARSGIRRRCHALTKPWRLTVRESSVKPLT